MARDTAMTSTPAVTRPYSPRTPKRRLNLGYGAWRELRRRFPEHQTSRLTDWQYRIGGAWLDSLGRLIPSPGPLSTDSELVFVLGHWRSGTTFLHELLCTNSAFNYPSTYACMNPQVFSLTEGPMLEHGKRHVTKRPMDEMTLSYRSPQEDEFALLCLGAPSPYAALLLPLAFDEVMADADPQDLPLPQRQLWIDVFSGFIAGLATRKPAHPIVLKSPTHTYRIGILNQLFPNARFVHIVRNPFEVYASSMKLWKSLFDLYATSSMPSDELIADFVLRNWIRMEEKLERAASKITSDRYIQVRYESLANNPIMELERIHGELDLPGFRAALPELEEEVARRYTFNKNNFESNPKTARKIRVAWRTIFDKYDYPTATPNP